MVEVEVDRKPLSRDPPIRSPSFSLFLDSSFHLVLCSLISRAVIGVRGDVSGTVVSGSVTKVTTIPLLMLLVALIFCGCLFLHNYFSSICWIEV